MGFIDATVRINKTRPAGKTPESIKILFVFIAVLFMNFSYKVLIEDPSTRTFFENNDRINKDINKTIRAKSKMIREFFGLELKGCTQKFEE